MKKDLSKFFSGKTVLITGGLGFIGSTIAHRLVGFDNGVKIILVDSLIPDYGGNLFNINGINKKVTVNISDVRDASSMNHLVKNVDLIFNMAGTLSHIDSLNDPFTDLEINGRSQISILEACRKNNPNVKIVFAGTRGQYGKIHPKNLPVTEEHTTVWPADPNGINNNLGEQYHLLYHNIHGINAASLRLTNTYGPRHQMKHSKQGFLNWFIRLAIDNQDITVYKPGIQLRDFNYVSDVVDALLMVMASKKTNGQVYNLGSGNPISVKDLGKLIVNIAGTGTFKFIPFPKDKKKIEIGHYHADFSKIKNHLGWQPKVELRDGLKQTIEYYRKHKKYYW